MQNIRKYCFFTILTPAYCLSANHHTLTSFVESNSFSDVLPIEQLIDDKWSEQPDNDAGKGFSQSEAGLSYQWHNVTFKYSYRFDFFAKANSETLNLIYLDKNDFAYQGKTDVDVHFESTKFRSEGLSLGYTKAIGNFSTAIELSYWEIDDFRYSFVKGLGYQSSSVAKDSNLQFTELYSKRNFLKRPYNGEWDQEGHGITMNIALGWTNNIVTLNFLGKDYFNEYKIDNVGFSEGDFDSNGSFINDNGFRTFVPVFRGRESSQDHEFSIPKRTNISAIYHHALFDYSFNYLRQNHVDFYYLGLGKTTESSSYRAYVNVKDFMPGVMYQNQFITLDLAIDDINVNKAYQARINVAINLSF